MNATSTKAFEERLMLVNGDMSKVGLPEKPFAEMTLKEIRDYVTFFVEIGYTNCPVKMEYEKRRTIRNQLNEEWNRRAGEDLTRIYDYYDKNENKEKYNGEERYKFFSYNFKGYTEFNILKKSKATLNFLRKHSISLDTFFELMNLQGNFWYWDMTAESTAVGSDQLKAKNNRYQNEFVNYVLGEMTDEEAKTNVWFTESFREPK